MVEPVRSDFSSVGGRRLRKSIDLYKLEEVELGVWGQSAAASWDVGWWVEQWPPSFLLLPAPAPALLSWWHVFFDHISVVAYCAFFQGPWLWGTVFVWVTEQPWVSAAALESFCYPHQLSIFHCSSNTEEDTVLQTNKQIYSQLLRATANRNSTLLERTEVIICLLEQLASGSSVSDSSAAPWPRAVPEDSVSAFPTQSCSVHLVLRLLNTRKCPLNSGDLFPTAGRGCGVVFGFFFEGEKPK